MPISSKTLIRSSALFLLIGLGALLGIVMMTLLLFERTQGYFEDVVAAREVRGVVVGLLSRMQDAEIGQRGYLLTGEEAYLLPYEQAITAIPSALTFLEERVADRPEMRAQLELLAPLLTAKLEEVTRTIDLARQGRVDEALAVVETDRGKALMDGVRASLGEMQRLTDLRLNTGVESQRDNAAAVRWVTIIGALVILAVVIGSAWMVTLYAREINAARRYEGQLNIELERRVRERTAELGRANEEVQRFAYIVTHDLRAPLVNIMGFTSELESSLASLQNFVANASIAEDDESFAEVRLAAKEDIPEALEFIRSSTKKMDGLINAILKLSREGRRKLKPEQIDLNAVLEQSAANVQHQVNEADGDVTLEIKVASLVTDRLALEQVFGNLLDNAVKYREPSRPLQIKIAAESVRDGKVLLSIADNGRGIAPQDHERVFELFRRSGSQNQPGEGIGLAHVRTVVRNLGGEITLESEFGQGTTFKISLPRDLRPVLRSYET
ncbi:MAG: CHASE3 domain-containing protein [Alphaproteobacteria bacterium]|nr:CHASE3 domain-containing protein [Alphaproteobacteria bacterium]MBU0796274.1 CHASE3 domain-containing protein [Alphaproteobacteria bacterium]MBU0887485.1 CHASE3 domain-containing protein [Alphaproteobacteria bacterium]MBU1813306.1 CHASE3 domain-containing protein [Alphaproteobacteria bacterium]